MVESVAPTISLTMLRTAMLGSFAVSSALVIGTPKVPTTRMSSPMMASVGDTLSTIDGPDIYWGDKGPLQNPMKEVSDCKEHGVDPTAADITVFAPGNYACEEYSAVYGPLSKAVCQYHVVKGVVKTDSLSSASLATVEGSSITYRRMFRKHFVDNAFCAAMSAPPRSSFKGDIAADNGVIHMVNEVIYPGWSESAGMESTRGA